MYPWHNEKVPGTGHDRARAGEEQIGEGIPHRADAQLVARIVLPEKIDDIEHFPTFVLGVVEPDKLRHQCPLTELSPQARCNSKKRGPENGEFLRVSAEHPFVAIFPGFCPYSAN